MDKVKSHTEGRMKKRNHGAGTLRCTVTLPFMAGIIPNTTTEQNFAPAAAGMKRNINH